MTVIIECISWLINVTDNNDARWKPEIRKYHVVCSLLGNSPASGVYMLTFQKTLSVPSS